MYFLLPLGVSGLTLLDLNLYLYTGVEEISLSNVDLAEEPVASGIYRIDNLPALSVVIRRTLTAEYPPGVGYSFVYGGEQSGTPETVIIPVRESGLIGLDFEFAIYRNGTSENDIIIEMGESLHAGGDYPVSGWPVEFTGAEWLLVWARAGSEVFSFYRWKESDFPVSATPTTLIFAQSIQAPFGIGPDGNGRDQVSCNYTAKVFRESHQNDSRPIDEYISVYLDSVGIGEIDVSLFFGRAVSVPISGLITQIIATGGYPGTWSHDDGIEAIETFQVVISGDYAEAFNLAMSIRKRLDGLRRIELIGKN